MRLVALILLWLSISTTGTLFDTSQILNYHNYGYTLRKMKSVYLATAEAKAVIHFKLPARFNVTRSAVNCSAMQDLETECVQMLDLLNMANNMRFHSNLYLAQTIDSMYNVIYDLPEEDRGKRGLWSAAWSAITGLAQKGDVDRLNAVLQKLERGMARAADSWKSGANAFVTALATETKRTDNLEAMIRMQTESILSVQRQLIPQIEETQRRTNFISTLLSGFLVPSIFQMSEVNELYHAIQILNSGRIPSYFVSHDRLQVALGFLKQKLGDDHPNLQVLISDLNYYYQHNDFHTFRKGQHLFIVLHVPISVRALSKPLEIIKVERIPLLIPDDAFHYTVMTDEFQYIAYSRDTEYYLTFNQMPFLRNGLILDLHLSNLHLWNKNATSCALSLIGGDLPTIKDLCQFKIKNTPIPSEFF